MNFVRTMPTVRVRQSSTSSSPGSYLSPAISSSFSKYLVAEENENYVAVETRAEFETRSWHSNHDEPLVTLNDLKLIPFLPCRCDRWIGPERSDTIFERGHFQVLPLFFVMTHEIIKFGLVYDLHTPAEITSLIDGPANPHPCATLSFRSKSLTASQSWCIACITLACICGEPTTRSVRRLDTHAARKGHTLCL